MPQQVSRLRELYREILGDFYRRCEPAIIEPVHATIGRHAASIAHTFYAEMLASKGSDDFLDNELVNERLHNAMTGWVSELFVIRDEHELDAFVAHQIEVGKIHARIDLPIHLFSHGIRAIKGEIFRRLFSAHHPQLAEMLQQTNEILDIITALITESYIIYLTGTERQTQALKMDVVGRHLVVECERMRATLLDWLRHTITDLHNGNKKLDELLCIRDSEFGLWAIHKAGMLLDDDSQIQDLCQDLSRIEAATQELFRATDASIENAALQRLNAAVTQTTWKLSTLANRLHEMETGRDPLTTLFNRRYLEPILKREVRYSIRHHRPFALLLVDIDHFKLFNDNHGHATGDHTLRGVAQIISDTVRVSDVIFRYGGEEFLILVSEMDQDTARSIGEKICQAVAGAPIPVENGHTVSVTISIGIAVHDGHPDYERLIDSADRALYQAKHDGRNCVRVG